MTRLARIYITLCAKTAMMRDFHAIACFLNVIREIEFKHEARNPLF